MRPLHIIAFALAGALLAYLVARQVAPQKLADLGYAVSSTYENLIARLEGFRSEPYQDQAGLWTIGFGHLIKPGDGFWSPSNPNGKKSISVDEARALYESDSAAARAAVQSNVRVGLTDAQFAALTSLAFNIGSGAFARSTLVRKLNEGDYAAAADQFRVWNKYTDDSGELVTSAGLTVRREKEREIFLS